MGQAEKALEMLEGLHAYLPDDENVLASTAQVYLMSGQLAKAKEPFQRAHARNPNDSSKRGWDTLWLTSSQQREMAAQIAERDRGGTRYPCK